MKEPLVETVVIPFFKFSYFFPKPCFPDFLPTLAVTAKSPPKVLLPLSNPEMLTMLRALLEPSPLSLG